MLMAQLRNRADMPEVLASTERLCALARVSNVLLEHSALMHAVGAGVPLEVRQVGAAFDLHGVDAIEIGTPMTDSEFLKLAGLLIGETSGDAETLAHSATMLGIWNVRFRSARNGAFVHARIGEASGPRTPVQPMTVQPLALAGRAPSASTVQAKAVMTAEVEEQLRTIAHAATLNDGRTLCMLLAAIQHPTHFAQAATPLVLQLVVEQLLETAVPGDILHTVLLRAGPAGARAAFSQLIAAIDLMERRVLYDVMVTLPATADVAREFLTHRVWYVVRNAVCLLGESRATSAIPLIGQALRHEDERVRIAAVVSLGQIGGPVAVARVESVLFDPSPDVRTRALSVVFAAPEVDQLPDRLVGILNDEQSLEYQLEMIAALSHLQTPRARQRLLQLCETQANSVEGTELRIAALEALRVAHAPLVAPLLAKLKDDPSPMMRERVASILG